ncbi:GIY-YIG nuclease family protein [Streptomyces niveus]|uniref:GIY-YIG nuclease family protein n=1 Tax=Streptomyces niveus TaxID=193462 RepID=UPI0036D43B5A
MSIYIYAISGTEQPAPVKIGKTVEVTRRLRQLQTGSPVPLRVWWQRETSDPDLESKLHQHFVTQRLSGEWFAFQYPDWPGKLERAAERLEGKHSVTWHAHMPPDGVSDWSPDGAGQGDRCICGHLAFRHAGPYACAGLDPRWNCHYECECVEFQSDAPWSLSDWQTAGAASGCASCRSVTQN